MTVKEEGKSMIKKLLSENRLQLDDEVKVVNRSDEENFKLVVRSKVFDPKDFSVKTVGNKLVVEAHYEEKELDATTLVKQHLSYEHELPVDVDPNSVKAFFPLRGFLQIEAPRIKKKMGNSLT